jgi:hypothetical protein
MHLLRGIHALQLGNIHEFGNLAEPQENPVPVCFSTAVAALEVAKHKMLFISITSITYVYRNQSSFDFGQALTKIGQYFLLFLFGSLFTYYAESILFLTITNKVKL